MLLYPTPGWTRTGQGPLQNRGPSSVMKPCRGDNYLPLCSERFVSAGEPTLPSQICSAGFNGDYPPCQRTVADQREADTETKVCGFVYCTGDH